MQQKIWIPGYWHLWCVLSPCACGSAAAELDYGTMVAIRSDSLYMFMEEPDVYPRTSDSPAWWNGILFLTFFLCALMILTFSRGKCSKDRCFHQAALSFKSKDELQKRGTTKPSLCTARCSVRPQKDANAHMEWLRVGANRWDRLLACESLDWINKKFKISVRNSQLWND